MYKHNLNAPHTHFTSVSIAAVVPSPSPSTVVASSSPVSASEVIPSHPVTTDTESLLVELLLRSPVRAVVVAFVPLERLAGDGIEERLLLVVEHFLGFFRSRTAICGRLDFAIVQITAGNILSVPISFFTLNGGFLKRKINKLSLTN